MTPEVAKEMEKKGYIADEDTLIENLKMTDVYYQNKAIRKLKTGKISDLIKLQSKQSKKLLNASTKSSKKIRDIVRKNRYKKPTLKKVALPKFKPLSKPQAYKLKLRSYKFS